MYSNLSIGFCNVMWLIEEPEIKIRIGQSSSHFFKTSLGQKLFIEQIQSFLVLFTLYIWPKFDGKKYVSPLNFFLKINITNYTVIQGGTGIRIQKWCEHFFICFKQFCMPSTLLIFQFVCTLYKIYKFDRIQNQKRKSFIIL